MNLQLYKISATFFLFVLVGVLNQWGPFGDLNIKTLDSFRKDHDPHPDLVVLAIDNLSLQQVGRFPWDRTVYANLLERLSILGPRAVVFDINFSEPQNDFSDNLLRMSVENSPFPVVFSGQGIYTKNSSEPSSFLGPVQSFISSTNASMGHVNTTPDSNGVLRYFPNELVHNGSNHQPLAFETLEVLGGTVPQAFGRQKDQIDFAGSAGAIKSYPFAKALRGEVGAEELRDKIILIGATASDLRDFVYVPLKYPLMSGVEWHGNVLDNLLTGRSIASAGQAAYLGWQAVLLMILHFALLLAKKPLWQVFSTLVLVITSIGVSYFMWENNYAMPFFSAVVLLVSVYAIHSLSEWYLAEREKRRLKKTLEVYFSPSVLKLLLEHPEKLKLGGERREVTILFSDIRSFTTITESLDPEVLSKLLHEYFTEMTEEVLSTDGVLDKFIGDAVMAFWGAPFNQPDQADRAVQAALGMMRRLEALQKKWLGQGLPLVDIGIGIASGMATVGNMGSKKRFDYTVIGDSVNAAARLEGLNKEHKTHIIISESTKDKLTLKIQAKFLGEVLVKGKTKGLNIYQVLE